MPTVVSQPLSSSARPAEVERARGRTRRTTWRRFAGATFLLVREKVKVRGSAPDIEKIESSARRSARADVDLRLGAPTYSAFSSVSHNVTLL
eukprot:6164630-Prymnesium_polylepis.1